MVVHVWQMELRMSLSCDHLAPSLRWNGMICYCCLLIQWFYVQLAGVLNLMLAEARLVYIQNDEQSPSNNVVTFKEM